MDFDQIYFQFIEMNSKEKFIFVANAQYSRGTLQLLKILLYCVMTKMLSVIKDHRIVIKRNIL